MKKVLLADTNISSEPIYRFLINSGFEVHTVGNNRNDYLARASSRYHHLNYSNPEEFRELIKKLGIDFLIPGCNDVSYLSCAGMADEFGLPGFDNVEVTQNINDKSKFRQICGQFNLNAPAVFEDVSVISSWPVIVKPVDAYSGRGITVVDKSESRQIHEAVAHAASFSRSGSYLIEEMVSGQLYSHSMFLENGEVVFDVIVEEHGSVNPFAVDTSRVVYDFDIQMLENIRQDILKLAASQGISRGLIHTQFISRAGQFWIVEVTRRCPGDLYAELVSKSTGYAYAENYTKPFIGRAPEAGHENYTKYVVRHTLHGRVGEILRNVSFRIQFEAMDFYPLINSGTEITGNTYGRIALLFAVCSDSEARDRLIGAFLNRTAYTIN